MPKVKLVIIVGILGLCVLAIAFFLIKTSQPKLTSTKKTDTFKESKLEQQLTKPQEQIIQEEEIPGSYLANLYNSLKQKIARGAEPPEWIEELVKIQEIALENDPAPLFELIQLIANEQHPGLKVALVFALGINKTEFVAQSIVKLMEQDTSRGFWLAAFRALALDPEKLEDRTSKKLFFKALFLHTTLGEWVTPEYVRKERAKLLGVDPELVILWREIIESYEGKIHIPEERLKKSQEYFSKRISSFIPDPLYMIVGRDYVKQAMGKISNDEIIKQLTDLMKKHEDWIIGDQVLGILELFDIYNETFQENFVRYYLGKDENPYKHNLFFKVAAGQLAKKDKSIQEKLQRQAKEETDPERFALDLLFTQQVSDETLIEKFITHKENISVQVVILTYLINLQKIDTFEKLYNHDAQLLQSALTKYIELITIPKGLQQEVSTMRIAEIYSKITNPSLRETIIDALANIKQKDRIVDLINELEAIESDPYLRHKIQSTLKK